ncbi:MAG: nucleoid-associated protein [Slackia sp.]|nr:nucleoid-associated protein [Slackia sp.]
MNINHAILHVFDFASCVDVVSEAELDLSNKQTRNYVTTHARRALTNIDNSPASFSQDSLFADELRAYYAGQRDFVGLSAQIAEFIGSELGHQDKPASTDVLVIDFEEAPEMRAGDADDEQAAAVFAGRAKRYLAVLLLESKQAYMHEVGRADDGSVRNSIARHYAILPNPSQKVASYAVVELGSMAVLLCDKPRSISGEERLVIADGLLQCRVEASGKEVIEAVTRIVEEVAEEYGANTAVALSKAKAHVAESAEEDEYLAPWDMAADVFEDEPLQKRFEEAVAHEQLPERVAVEKKVAQRVAKNHKIRTDTGIEITFPSEYSNSSEFIEFVNAPNGLIQIELKNIGSIENR